MQTKDIFDGLENGIFSVCGGGFKNMSMGMKIVVGLIIVGLIILVVLLFWWGIKHFSGFGNGRVVGSGCGRYNQLQRAVNFEFPISQSEYENAEASKQRHAGIQYANSWQPDMENVYSGFSDKATEAEVQQYQVVPSYPQTGYQSVFNDNVFKNIAYTD